MLRLLSATLLGAFTTLGTFWLMLSMTVGATGLEQRRAPTAIEFIRLPPRPEPQRRREELTPPERPPETVPEIDMVTPQVPRMRVPGIRLPGLEIPAMAALHDAMGTPYLGAEPISQPSGTGLRILNRIPPLYPARALLRRTEGWVRLQLSIDAEGLVEDARVLEASPEGVFEKAALKAVRRWRFEPPTGGEGRAPVQVTQKIEFKLER
jgi:protein TonB